jgi:tRNA pseudouridine38-40 synthase
MHDEGYFRIEQGKDADSFHKDHASGEKRRYFCGVCKKSALRYFIEISYNGSSFCGWQIQPNGPSVQQELETALGARLREQIALTGAGRTDAGVHALRFFAHFDSVHEDLASDPGWVDQLNRMLHRHIRVHAIHRVAEQSHARFDAVSRSYLYRLARSRDPFTCDLAYHFYFPLDWSAMQKASQLLMTIQDFTSFAKLHTDVKTNNCAVFEAYWEEVGTEWHFHISADRFLRNMVRAVVGTLLDIGRGKMPPEDILCIASLMDRGAAGTSVPAHGLYLVDIRYPLGVFI